MNFNDIRITEEEAKTFEDLVEKREALENLVFIIDNNPIAYHIMMKYTKGLLKIMKIH